MSTPNMKYEEMLNSSIFLGTTIKVKCEIHQTLNKYYIKKENKFVCEYDGFDLDTPSAYLHMPQILELYRDEILQIQKNPISLQNTRIEEVVPFFSTRLKKLNIDSSKLTYDFENFKSTLYNKVLFILRNNNNLYDIKDLINEVRFTSDGKPDLKKIGMDEKKEINLIFLAQFLILRGGENSSEKDLTEKFTDFLEEIQKNLAEIIFNSIEFIDVGYDNFLEQLAKQEKKTPDRKNREYLKSLFMTKKQHDTMVNNYEINLNKRDSDYNELFEKLKQEKSKTLKLEKENSDIVKENILFENQLKERSHSLKNRITELENIILGLRYENDEFKNNQMKYGEDQIIKLKALHENQLDLVKKNHHDEINKQKANFEKIIQDLKNQLESQAEEYNSMNSLVSSSKNDMSSKRYEELEEILNQERVSKEDYISITDKKIADLNNKIMELQKLNNEIKKKILELENQVKSEKEKNDFINKEKELLRKELHDKEPIIDKIIEDDKNIRLAEKKSNEQLLSKVNELNKLHEKINKDIENNEEYKKYFVLYVEAKRDLERNILENNQKKKIVTELEGENTKLRSELNSTVKNLKEIVMDFEVKNQDLNTENHLLESQLTDKSNKLELVRKQLEVLYQKLKDLPFNPYNEFKRNNQNKENKFKDKENINKEKENEVLTCAGKTNTPIQVDETRINELKTALKAEEIKNTELTALFKRDENKVSELNLALKKEIDKINVLQAALKKEDEKNHELFANLQKVEELNKQFIFDFKKEQESNKNLQNLLKNKEEKINQLMNDLNQGSEEKNYELLSSLKKEQDKNSQLLDISRKQEEEIKENQAESQEIHKLLLNQKNTIKDLDISLDKEQHKNKELLTLIEKGANNIHQLQTENGVLQQYLQTQQKNIEELKELLKRENEEKEEMKQYLDKQDETIKDLDAMLKEEQEKKQEIPSNKFDDGEIQELQMANTELQNILKKQEEKLRELNAMLKKEQEKNQELIPLIKKEEDNLKELASLLKKEQDNNKEVIPLLKKAEDKIKELQKNLNNEQENNLELNKLLKQSSTLPNNDNKVNDVTAHLKKEEEKNKDLKNLLKKEEDKNKEMTEKLKENQKILENLQEKNTFNRQNIKPNNKIIENFNNIVMKLPHEEKVMFINSQMFEESPASLSEKDMLNIDFRENDFYSLLLLNRKNFKMVNSWLNHLRSSENIKLNLLLKASIDGYGAKDFKKKCYGIPNTLIVVLTSFDKLIGGFTPLKWASPTDDDTEYIEDQNKNTFLFSLTLEKKFKLIAEEFAILNSIEMGPIFGGGSDLEIVDNCNVNLNKFSSIGHSFENHDVSPEEYYGNQFYYVKDYEVYQVLL